MNRRAILAGLLAVALVALVVVLASSGGGGQETEITQGKPFTGELVRDAQRRLDRGQPAISGPRIRRSSARRPSEAAAEEAAREQAGEEAADEGEAQAEERGRRRGGRGGSRPRRDEAAAGRGETAGERPLDGTRAGRRAAGEPTSARSRSRPARRRATEAGGARGLRLQRAGSAAIGPKQAVSDRTTFPRRGQQRLGVHPAGLDGRRRARPRSWSSSTAASGSSTSRGTPIRTSDVTDSAFWAPVPQREWSRPTPGWSTTGSPSAGSSPRSTPRTSDNRVMLAVSDGPTITEQSELHVLRLQPGRPAAGRRRASPTTRSSGSTTNAIYIGVNEFTSSSGRLRRHDPLRDPEVERDWGPGRSSSPASATSSPRWSGPGHPQPADRHGSRASPRATSSGPTTQFASRLDVRADHRPGRHSDDLGEHRSPSRRRSRPAPFSVPAQGTTGGLDALDDRLFEAMIAKGPDGTTRSGRPTTSWSTRPERRARAAIATRRAGTSSAISTPTPSPDPVGHRCSTRRPPTRFILDPLDRDERPGTCLAQHEHRRDRRTRPRSRRRAGCSAIRSVRPRPSDHSDPVEQARYNLGSGTPRRWGDYSQTVVDPTDNQTFWTFQEYTSAQNVWGVRVIQLKAPPPADPAIRCARARS